MQLEYRKRLARVLAGIDEVEDPAAVVEDLTGYFAEVFRVEELHSGSSNGAQVVDDIYRTDQPTTNGTTSTRVDDA